MPAALIMSCLLATISQICKAIKLLTLAFNLYHRDMTLHKIIFKPHGVPDGTKLAYYVKGQVAIL
jgi:hypothetical protein